MAASIWSRLTMGVCYYPEHWDPALWRDDLRRMKDAGISVIRIAEFAWNKFEPTEGEFTFDFFDGFLSLCQEEGMYVIFGTPTATPPAWLTEKYPECLNALPDGTLLRHGSRRHYNYNSPKYRELCSRVVEKIAEHLGQHPMIVGWQIDNELNCETNVFYSDADSEAFRKFLYDKYGTLENLNRAWGTAFWNQDYTDWQQVYVPRTTLHGNHNPHQELDYRRFIAHSAQSFCKMQSDILRRYIAPWMFITTNGLFGHLDNHKMTEECLDVYTYDCYPNFAFNMDEPFDHDALNDRKWSRSLIEVRSICPHFGIMEQQSGSNGWVTRMEGPMPRPGQLTLWSMQSIAHGADFVSYFRWRTCAFGTEIYWHGILNYDNRDNRRLAEVKQVSSMMEKLQPLCGADSVAAFALVTDYDNQWDTEVDVWHNRLYSPSRSAVFEAAQRSHTPYDMLFLHDDTPLSELQRYPVLIYPHALILTPERAALLKAYVAQGGTLILGCRTGMKDINGQCPMAPMPGLLSDITGTTVEDFTFQTPAEPIVHARWGNNTLETPVFHDILHAHGNATVLARYDSSFYKGQPALVENHVGKGRVLHLGSVFSKDNVIQLLRYCGVLTPMASQIQLPEGVELTVREKDGKRYCFLLNYQPTAQTVIFRKSMYSLLAEEDRWGNVELPPFGVDVVMVN